MTVDTISKADLDAADERLKAAVLRDLTPNELAVVARASDPEQALDNAFTDLMRATDRLLYKRAKEQLSDDEFDDLHIGELTANPRIIIRTLVDDYSVEHVCKWAKEVGDEEVGEEQD